MELQKLIILYGTGHLARYADLPVFSLEVSNQMGTGAHAKIIRAQVPGG